MNCQIDNYTIVSSTENGFDVYYKNRYISTHGNLGGAVRKVISDEIFNTPDKLSIDQLKQKIEQLDTKIFQRLQNIKG